MSKPARDTKPNWNSFTKAELIKTVKALHVRQTRLLNRIASLERQLAPAPQHNEHGGLGLPFLKEEGGPDEPPVRFPWET